MTETYLNKINNIWQRFVLNTTTATQKRQGQITWYVDDVIHQDHNPSHERMILEGWYKLVDTVYDSVTHKLVPDSYTMDGETISQDTIELTAEEITDAHDAQKLILVSAVYEMARLKQSAVTAHYSPAEMSRWAEWVTNAKISKAADDVTPDTGDWTFLKNMVCGSVADCSGCDGAACQDYGTTILAKNAILKEYSDAVVLARNGHKKAISETADADLIDYDINLLWPEELDADNILYSVG